MEEVRLEEKESTRGKEEVDGRTAGGGMEGDREEGTVVLLEGEVVIALFARKETEEVEKEV